MVSMMLRLLLNEDFVYALWWALAYFTPLLFLFLSLVARSWFTTPFHRALGWVVCLSGPLLLALWHFCSLIDGVYGLDSLMGLGLKLSTFVCLGILLGVILRHFRAEGDKEGSSSDESRPEQ